jgi:hypothetical protein
VALLAEVKQKDLQVSDLRVTCYGMKEFEVRDLDVSSAQEPVHLGAFSPGPPFPWVRRDTGGEQHLREPADNTPNRNHRIPPSCGAKTSDHTVA